MRWGVVLLLLALAGCPDQGRGGPGGTCIIDEDCAGQTCTRPDICSGQPGAVTVRWTVDGVTPTLAAPAGCTSIGDLRLEVVFRGAVTQLVYVPVPCAQGQTRIDRLPLDSLSQLVLKRASGAGDTLVAQVGDLRPRDDGGALDELAVLMPLRTR